MSIAELDKFDKGDRVVYKYEWLRDHSYNGKKGTVLDQKREMVDVQFDGLTTAYTTHENNLTLLENRMPDVEYENAAVKDLVSGEEFEFTVKGKITESNNVNVGCKAFTRKEIEEVGFNIRRVKKPMPKGGEVWSAVWDGAYDVQIHGLYRGKVALFMIKNYGVISIASGSMVNTISTFMDSKVYKDAKKIQNSDGSPA